MKSSILKYLSLIASINIIAGAILLHPYFNGKNKVVSFVHTVFWGDIIRLELGGNLKKENITIVFKNEMALIKETRPLEYERLRKYFNYPLMQDTIFRKGEQIMDIPYDYGKQMLSIYYDGVEVGMLGLWRTNSWYSHRYYVSIKEDLGEVKMIGKITGPDVERFGSWSQ